MQAYVDGVPFAGTARDALAPPQPPYVLQVLEGDRGAVGEAVGVQGEVARVPAARAADADPAAGEVVGHRPLLGDPHGVVQREDHRARVQTDAAGLPGERGGQDGRVGEEAAEGVEVAFGEPERAEVVGVGEACGLYQPFVGLGAVLAVGVVAEEVDTEVGGGAFGGLAAAVTSTASGRRREVAARAQLPQ